MRRRGFLKLAGAAAALAASAKTPALALPDRVTVGYVHALAVDGQLWLADSMGLWKNQNLDMHFIEFQNGIEAFQAMAAGSLDVLVTGATISHYPAAGQGKVFLINDIEYATAQLWCHPDMGIARIADLKGKKVTTTAGTTAHIFLDIALRASGVDPADVLIINQRIADAVAAFVSKAVPAIALWIPHNNLVKERSPSARMLADASAYFPEAAIIDGWVARKGFYEKNKPVLARIVSAWARANDLMVIEPERAIGILHDKYYSRVSLDELRSEFGAQKVYSSQEWQRLYRDGTVTNWLQRITNFYISFAAIRTPIPAAEYFDPSIYLDAVGTGASAAERR
jgi:NitT/TauT family transport system substrate-binding protein